MSRQFELNFTVGGMPSLIKAFEGLPPHVMQTGMKAAISQAGYFMMTAIQDAIVPGKYSKGNLRASIQFRPTTIGGVPSGIVVPNRKRGAPIGRHATLIEYGVHPHQATYYGHPYNHPGFAARPFFWPTVNRLQDDVREMMAETISNSIDYYWEQQGSVK